MLLDSLTVIRIYCPIETTKRIVFNLTYYISKESVIIRNYLIYLVQYTPRSFVFRFSNKEYI